MAKDSSKLKKPTIVRYPEVFAFANKMDEKLHQNSHKGHWSGDTVQGLMRRLQEEVNELKEAVANGADYHTVLGEAADIGNFAMMVADNYGRETQ